MSKVMFKSTYLAKPEWTTAGPDAFMLHMAAACWSDLQYTDGRVPKVQVKFLCPALATTRRVNAAAARLLEHQMWTDDGDDYVLTDFFDLCLSADEKRKTNARWASDKQRQRMHGNGVHDLCDPNRCPGAAAISASMSTADSTAESSILYSTPPDTTGLDPTGPDPTEGKGRGQEEGPRRHAYADDGSGASCMSCGLPATHARHLGVLGVVGA